MLFQQMKCLLFETDNVIHKHDLITRNKSIKDSDAETHPWWNKAISLLTELMINVILNPSGVFGLFQSIQINENFRTLRRKIQQN